YHITIKLCKGMQYDQFNKMKIRRFTVPTTRFVETVRSVNYLKDGNNILRTSLIFSALFFSQLSNVHASSVNVPLASLEKNDKNYLMNGNPTINHANPSQEKVTVKGIVKDGQNQPIPGVSIRVKETSAATSSDKDGLYEIELEKGQTLTFNIIGYSPYEVVIKAGGQQDVTLSSSSEDITEVVVVGYGSQQKKDVTGSIATVSMKNIKGQAIASPDQALTGQISGV